MGQVVGVVMFQKGVLHWNYCLNCKQQKMQKFLVKLNGFLLEEFDSSAILGKLPDILNSSSLNATLWKIDETLSPVNIYSFKMYRHHNFRNGAKLYSNVLHSADYFD